MTRTRKIATIVAVSLTGLMLAVFVAGILIVQTNWFRNMVREKIVSAVEEATGGKVEIASFDFDWRHLRAQVRGLVVHGLEPATAAPLLRANLVEIDLKLLSPFRGFVDLAYLLVDTPQANLIVYPDGHTNMPAPKVQPKSSGKTGVESIVDLAIGRFDLRNGSLTFANRKSELNASGGHLRAQLSYSLLPAKYTGEIDISPLYVRTGANPQLNLDIKLPLTIEKDKITLTHAQVSTPQSQILISGSMEHLISPKTTAQVNARLALDEIAGAMGLTKTIDAQHGPRFLTADAAGSMDDAGIRVQSARIALGHSELQASGTLRETGHANALHFSSTVSLGEVASLFRVAGRPEGTVNSSGDATLDANDYYKINASVNARDVAYRQGTTHIAGVSLQTEVAADNHRIQLSGTRVAALGGSFAGSATVVDLAQFHVGGNLRGFGIAQVGRALMNSAPGYDGIISGPVEAGGSLQNPSALIAKANLAIAPGTHGIPVSGHLGIDYNGSAQSLNVDHSRLALPHTIAEFSGSLDRQIQVRVVSRNFADLQPIAAIPVSFTGAGAATVNATVTGSLAAPHITGQAAVSNFSVSGHAFTRLSATLDASPNGAAVKDAVLSRGQLQAQFSGSVGLHNWKPENYEALQADLSIQNADLSDVLALAGQSGFPASGALTAGAHIHGTVGSPAGSADVAVTHGALESEPFDSFNAHAALSQTSIDLPTCSLVAGLSRVDVTAHYRHGVNDLQLGMLTAQVKSSQVQLARFQSLVKDRPGLGGLVNLDAGVTAEVSPVAGETHIQLIKLDANLAARNLQMQGKPLGDFTATASTAGPQIQYKVESNFAGSTIQVRGQSLLAGDHQTSAAASIANLPVDRVLGIAGRRDIPFKGSLTANARVSGTLQSPQGEGTINVVNGSAYGEPFTRLETALNYTPVLIEVKQLRVDDGPSNLEASGSFSHPAGDFGSGQLRIHAASSDVQLSHIHTLTDARQGLAGTVQLTADAAAVLHGSRPPAFSMLNAKLSAKNLSIENKPLGNLTVTAETRGNAVAFAMNSDIAKARIQGSGEVGMTAGYPIDAQLKLAGVTWSGLRPLLGGEPQPFDASLDGQITVSGSATQTDTLRGTLELTKLEGHSVATGSAKTPRASFAIQNTGNVEASLANSVVTVRNFRLAGKDANLAISGTAALKNGGNGAQPFNLRANGNINLALLEALDPDIYSSGAVTLNASVTGSAAQPVVRGRLQLQNAAVNLPGMPIGLSKANGGVNFNGSEAVIDNLTGESGGGKVTLSGFYSYGGDEDHFRVQANATRVHIDYPETVTTEANARLTITGSQSRSLVSGTITVVSVAMHSHSDIGSILSTSATPPSTSAPSTGLLAGMRFDVRIRTSPGIQFRTDLTQNLDADAELTLRGSPDNPGMIGRLTVNSGDLIFFGAPYAVDQGTITFSNPNKIDPILNVDLETTAQGVDVTINVSGPMDKLKLTYHSDPPLEFQQLISLLAAGQTPTTDPVIASEQPPAPQQSFGQAGASAVLGQAVANPVSNRLQRLFGVSKLSINPQIVGESSNNPQATLTLQQQISRNITFTYIQDVTQSTPSAIRIEWRLNPHYSVVAQRDIFGEFAVDLFYKKRFH